jgi:hypothetical protein
VDTSVSETDTGSGGGETEFQRRHYSGLENQDLQHLTPGLGIVGILVDPRQVLDGSLKCPSRKDVRDGIRSLVCSWTSVNSRPVNETLKLTPVDRVCGSWGPLVERYSGPT